MAHKENFLKNAPNLITLMNMLSGLVAILVLIQVEHPNKILIVTALILFGGVFDFFDGYFARKFDAISNIGKQLDSFADIITFGVAPVMLLSYISSNEPFVLAIIVSPVFVMAGAFRLARFNLEEYSGHFRGLPITAAGGILAIYCALYPLWASSLSSCTRTIVTTVFVVFLSIMMVSRKKVKKIFSKIP